MFYKNWTIPSLFFFILNIVDRKYKLPMIWFELHVFVIRGGRATQLKLIFKFTAYQTNERKEEQPR